MICRIEQNSIRVERRLKGPPVLLFAQRHVGPGVANVEIKVRAVGALEVVLGVLALGHDAVWADAALLGLRLVPQYVVAGELGAILAHEGRLLDVWTVRGATIGAAQAGHLLGLVLVDALALER